MGNLETVEKQKHMSLSSPTQLRQALSQIKHVALDMDGTIYNGTTLFPYTVPFLARLKELGIGFSFLTNNPSKSIDDYMEHLHRMGIPAKREQMYTSAQATIEFIQKQYPAVRRLFLLGTPSMIKEFEGAGFISTADSADDIPDAVVVSFDMTLTYARLCRAAWWISQDMPYIATNPDRVCPTDKQIVLVDCGSIYACLAEAAGRMPDVVVGKPDPRMLDGILSRHSLEPSQVCMVGDRIYTDVKMAQNAGAMGVLVLSGETTMEIVKQSDSKPDVIADDLEEFLEMLEECRSTEDI